jgi:hypothetical protein
MDLEEFKIQLREKIKAINEAKYFNIAIQDVASTQAERIFEEGKNESGETHQYNSIDPIYISQNKTPKGKGGYFKSYKAFRQSIGRDVSKVNFRLTNDLQSDFINRLIPESSNKVGEANPIKVNNWKYRIAFKRALNIKKAEGLEKRYGKIFGLTRGEKDHFTKVVQFEFKRLIL